MLKKVFKILAWIIGIPVVLIGIFVLALTITDYKPKDIEMLSVKNKKSEIIKKDKTFSITTYNIGYCGMDKDVDFFMDGGKGSRSISKAKTVENLKGIVAYLEEEKSDIIFVQEADVNSTRSYKVNEYDYIVNTLEDYSTAFAYNYKVRWVPVPISKPHGKVNGGMMTLSKFNTSSATRYKYPGTESWPRQLADLDRCFIENRMPVQGGKELVLINSHLSAYDKGGTVRKQQLGFLKNYITKEYKKGNYVIVGGDWNHLIPGTDPYKFKSIESWPEWLQKIPGDFKPENFKWAADDTIPTTRTDGSPYKKDVNFTAVIDGFLISPNVEAKKVKTHSLDFKYTDHNPVTGYFVLR